MLIKKRIGSHVYWGRKLERKGDDLERLWEAGEERPSSRIF